MTTESHQMLDNTRRMASEALDRANAAMREARTNAQDIASRGWSSVSERATAARGHLGAYASSGRQYVSEHPMKSALIAAAIGAAVAGLVIALRKRDHSDL